MTEKELQAIYGVNCLEDISAFGCSDPDCPLHGRKAKRMAELGITDQDIQETMPPKPEEER